jgi:hypothetical protein
MFILVFTLLIITILKLKIVLTKPFQKPKITKSSNYGLKRLKSSSDDLYQQGLPSENLHEFQRNEDKIDPIHQIVSIYHENKKIIRNIYMRNYIFTLTPIKMYLLRITNQCMIMYHYSSEFEKALFSLFIDSLFYQ